MIQQSTLEETLNSENQVLKAQKLGSQVLKAKLEGSEKNSDPESGTKKNPMYLEKMKF